MSDYGLEVTLDVSPIVLCQHRSRSNASKILPSVTVLKVHPHPSRSPNRSLTERCTRDGERFTFRGSIFRIAPGSSNILNYRRSVDLHARRERFDQRIRKFASRGEEDEEEERKTVRVLESSEEKERERERRRGAEFLRPRIAIVGREDSANRIPVSFTGENEQRATREVGERA